MTTYSTIIWIDTVRLRLLLLLLLLLMPLEILVLEKQFHGYNEQGR